MPFLVRDVHGLSGLALANAEPAGSRTIKAEEPPRRRRSHSRLTSDQVHVDQVGFDVSRFLWLIPQALQGETESGVSLGTPQTRRGYGSSATRGRRAISALGTPTRAHLCRHAVHPRGRAAAQGDKRQLVCAVSSSTALRKTSAAARSFPVGTGFSEALKYDICTVCSTDISSVLITPVIAHAKHRSARISKQADFPTTCQWESERVCQAQILVLHAVKCQEENGCHPENTSLSVTEALTRVKYWTFKAESRRVTRGDDRLVLIFTWRPLSLI